MVKKKSPIIPLTFVAIGVAVAFAVNSRIRPVDPKDQAPPTQDQPQQMKPIDKSQMKGAMAQELSNHGPGKPKMGLPGAPDAPHNVMVGQKPEPYRPKPNPSSTNSEWYTNR